MKGDPCDIVEGVDNDLKPLGRVVKAGSKETVDEGPKDTTLLLCGAVA